MVSNVLIGDALRMLQTFPDGSVQCCVTSPPYFGLRDYSRDGQIGLEATPELYVTKLVAVFREVRRVLRDDGTLWLNLGDCYNGSGKGQSATGENDPKKRKTRGMKVPVAGIGKLKHKDLIGIPWRVAFALQANGWYLRQDIIWQKPNPMPESVTDRCTKAHEYIFLLSKSPQYFFDAHAIKEDAVWDVDGTGRIKRNKRSVWTVATKAYSGPHCAAFPSDLIAPCILAGSPEGAVVLDPFLGSGTTAMVAKQLKRRFVGIELNASYLPLIDRRLDSAEVTCVA